MNNNYDKEFAESMGFTLEEVQNKAIQNSLLYQRFVLNKALKNLFYELTRQFNKILSKLLSK